MTGPCLTAGQVCSVQPVGNPARAGAAGRIASLDLARFLMALLVIGAHGRLFVDVSYPVYFATFVGGWARLIMPIFLMISGYYFAVQVRRGVWRWARRILILHLVWSTIYIGAWMPLDSFSAGKAAFWYFFGAGHLWFMPAMLGGGLMLYALREWATRPLLLLAVALYFTGGAVQYAMDMVIDFETVAHHNALYALPRNFLFYGFPFMALGHLMAREDVLARVQAMARLPLFAGLLGLLALEIYVKYVAFPHEAVFEVTLANILVAPLIFVWLLGLENVRAAPWMAPVSAAIYFVHALVLIALEQVTGLTPSLLTLVAVAVCIPVGLGLVKINNRPLPLV